MLSLINDEEFHSTESQILLDRAVQAVKAFLFGELNRFLGVKKSTHLKLSMPLFEFDLANIEDIAPWGKPPNQSLSWFSLTDGVYHMDVCGKQLFRYSNEIRAHWKLKHPHIKDTPFVNHQVVRLWEDILQMLPNILNPLPDALFNLIATGELQKNFETRMRALVDDEASDEKIELYYSATEWIGCRYLASLHLAEGPNILIFRHEDEITGIRIWLCFRE